VLGAGMALVLLRAADVVMLLPLGADHRRTGQLLQGLRSLARR
jgi:hypothetical protein